MNCNSGLHAAYFRDTEQLKAGILTVYVYTGFIAHSSSLENFSAFGRPGIVTRPVPTQANKT
jgi:hypothetical protein